MQELIARAMQGVDPDDPGATMRIFLNLMALVPWWQLVIWQIVFVGVGGLLGWWRGRVVAGVVAALIFGPFGWIVPFLPRRSPPPTARRTQPPPLPGSKKR